MSSRLQRMRSPATFSSLTSFWPPLPEDGGLPINIMGESRENGKWWLPRGRKHVSLQGPPGAFSALFSYLAYKSEHHSWGTLQCTSCGYFRVLKLAECRAGQRITQENIQRIMSQDLKHSPSQQTKSGSFLGKGWIKRARTCSSRKWEVTHTYCLILG